MGVLWGQAEMGELVPRWPFDAVLYSCSPVPVWSGLATQNLRVYFRCHWRFGPETLPFSPLELLEGQGSTALN